MHIGPISTDTYLVGLNENNGEIKFISGQFFKSVTSDDFNLDKKDPNTLIPYIEMRSYVIKPIDIEFVKKKHRNMIYSAYSDLYSRKVIILVPTKDIDDVAFLVNPKTYYLLTHKRASID